MMHDLKGICGIYRHGVKLISDFSPLFDNPGFEAWPAKYVLRYPGQIDLKSCQKFHPSHKFQCDRREGEP